MARIAGIDIPKNKRIEVSLTYLYGVGRSRAQKVCKDLGFAASKKTHELTDAEVASIRDMIEANFKVEGDLRRDIGLSIKRLMDMGNYRGVRHRRGLPVRGQSTQQNARTRKGPKKTVANKKKAV